VTERTAFAKVRSRIRRQVEAVEESEHEGGELNLVPYLDIITNTVIFLLATTASVVALANINVTAPRYAPPSEVASDTPPEPQKAELNLTVTVSYTGFIIAGSGAVLPGSDGKLPTIKCQAALKKGRCPAFLGTRVNEEGVAEPVWNDNYDYRRLAEKVGDIKTKYPHERRVILMADRTVPYQVVVRAMDTLRGKPTSKCTGEDDCLFDQVILSAGVQ
jgi:biopolymer transport protein TolR